MCSTFVSGPARPFRAVLLMALFSLPSAVAAAQEPTPTAPECRPAGSVVKVPELPEASGLAISRSVPGRLWAHNDSGEPVLFALGTNGSVLGRLRLEGAEGEDWEAIAVGPCPAGSCIQGEAVAIDADGTIYLAGEGGGKSQPGTFARLTCRLGR